MDLELLADGLELRSRYDFACAACGAQQQAAPSVFMKMGYNSGSGRCLRCKTNLRLRITAEGDGMSSEVQRRDAQTGEAVN